MLAELLAGSSQTSVLARELVLTGKALYVDASYDGFSVDPTTFGLSLVPAPGVENADAEAALDAALAKFVRTARMPHSWNGSRRRSARRGSMPRIRRMAGPMITVRGWPPA